MIRTVSFLAALTMAAAAQAATVPSYDSTFATTAAGAGKAEVAEAQLALKISQRSDVRAFAQRMVQDHTSANMKLEEIAKELGLALPANLTPDDQAKLDKLNGLSGDAFDKQYIADQVAAHDSAVSLFDSETNKGQQQQLEAFATSTLPVLKAHQAMIHQMAGQ